MTARMGRSGSELMVHGDCSSRGCYAMTDEQMVEIYALARESFFGGQKSFQVQAYPFRMTAANMAKHRTSPHLAFWKMLKTGYDHFEVTKQEPKVDVCEKRYVFDAGTPDGARPARFVSQAKCPVYEVPKDIAEAVEEKQERDNKEYASLVAGGASVVASRKGIDGGMNPVFYAKLNPQSNAEYDDRRPPVIPVLAAPGALPRTPNNPPAQIVPPAQPRVEVASAERVAGGNERARSRRYHRCSRARPYQSHRRAFRQERAEGGARRTSRPSLHRRKPRRRRARPSLRRSLPSRSLCKPRPSRRPLRPRAKSLPHPPRNFAPASTTIRERRCVKWREAIRKAPLRSARSAPPSPMRPSRA